MAEYIEREALDRAISRNRKHFNDESDFDQIGIIVMTTPNADVVEVVRCKDCKMCEFCYPEKRIGEDAIARYVCHLYKRAVLANDYCSMGAKMDGKGEGE